MEIGSYFWLTHDEINRVEKMSLIEPKIFEGASYVSTCRSAIGIVLDKLLHNNRKVALVPAFTCESVLVSFKERGYKIYPYPIRKNFTIQWKAFEERIDEAKPSVVLIHSYFGFDTITELRPHVLELRKKDIVVIEDETQSMFSCNPLINANYYVGSIRKWMPLPDGAFVTASNYVNQEDTELIEAKIRAYTLKGKWMQNPTGSKTDFQKAFQTAEGILNNRKQPFSMSKISRKIFHLIDKDEMKEIRRNNYCTLVSGITLNRTLSNKLSLPISTIGENECPFHLPVLVKEGRNELQKYLAQHDIFATVIWGCPDEFKDIIDDESKYIYNHILCFHVDQRYGEKDMVRIINILKDYYSA